MGIVAFDLAAAASAAAETSRMNRTANATTKPHPSMRESRRCRQSVISAALLRGLLVFAQNVKRVTVDTRGKRKGHGASRGHMRVALEFARSLLLRVSLSLSLAF